MSDSQVHVSVHFFASARELTGERLTTLSLDNHSTIASLKTVLIEKYPALETRLDHFLISVNQDFVEQHTTIQNGDEIGIFPPVSGGDEYPLVTLITEKQIDLNELSKKIQAPHTGAAVIFTGFVRGQSPGTTHPQTLQLNYEAYEPMARKMMQQIDAEIHEKWPKVYGVFLVQRIGILHPMEITTAIGVSSGHRDEGAFEAAKYGINRLKEIVPVWKKEIGPAGEEWIEGTHHPGK
jgi:molybdopterin synthase catalytic subunit